MQEINCKCSAGEDPVLGLVDDAIKKYEGQPDNLIEALHAIQKITSNSLPEHVAKLVACKLGMPVSKVYGVATFYSIFSTKPRGRYVIRMCKSAPCHVVGAGNVMKAFEKKLGIKVGETTYDGKFTLEYCECLGICHESPAVMINDDVYGNLTPEGIQDIIQRY